MYSTQRLDYTELNDDNYISVDNLLQNKLGKKKSEFTPTAGKWIKYNQNDILIGNIRPYLRKIWFASNTGGTNGDVLVIQNTNKEILYDKFLYYVLSSEDFFTYDISFSKGAKMPRGDKEAIMNYYFCVPSLEEQERIVSTLDKFDAYCNDITQGLPAEIEMRQKQYEYYRDKLLTFKRLEA